MRFDYLLGIVRRSINTSISTFICFNSIIDYWVNSLIEKEHKSMNQKFWSIPISIFYSITETNISPALHHLSEFIEDCEHGVLATKILHLLGREGPKTKSPSKFIRYIYNRIILENPTVSNKTVTNFIFVVFITFFRQQWFSNCTTLFCISNYYST